MTWSYVLLTHYLCSFKDLKPFYGYLMVSMANASLSKKGACEHVLQNLSLLTNQSNKQIVVVCAFPEVTEHK